MENYSQIERDTDVVLQLTNYVSPSRDFSRTHVEFVINLTKYSSQIFLFNIYS